ncbi:MAG: NAD(P)/FAD-dependent oxidoreductase [Chloroflexi bacterium]|nr:NAD(P)/FAD-dependent oxidoreductase [Chloroflexota bacterium]
MAAPRVVIIGAGFGGLECARKLAGRPVAVLLIDRNNYHLFTPLLYQVASSLLNPSDIARPVRSIFSHARNVAFRQAEVVGIDFKSCTVATANGDAVPYDTLVIAAGSTTNYFGIEAAERQALGLKDLSEALELRNHILRCLETASTTDAEGSRPWLTFVVVGGGPTGVEYAGALSELMRLVLPHEYPELAGRPTRIILVEGLAEVLPPFPPELGALAHRELQRKGIEVRTGVRVAAVEGDTVVLSGGDRLEAKTLVWAAGVKPAALASAIHVPRARGGRLQVDAQLRCTGLDNVYAIGDIASFTQDGHEVPMLSAPAMQEGRLVAANILHSVRGEPLDTFRYRDKGSMATVGKGVAVARLGPLNLSGFVGWLAWLTVHLYYIIGFRNRLAVLMGWAWNYVRSDRPVRIIARARQRDAPPPSDGGSSLSLRDNLVD